MCYFPLGIFPSGALLSFIRVILTLHCRKSSGLNGGWYGNGGGESTAEATLAWLTHPTMWGIPASSYGLSARVSILLKLLYPTILFLPAAECQRTQRLMRPILPDRCLVPGHSPSPSLTPGHTCGSAQRADGQLSHMYPEWHSGLQKIVTSSTKMPKPNIHLCPRCHSFPCCQHKLS